MGVAQKRKLHNVCHFTNVSPHKHYNTRHKKPRTVFMFILNTTASQARRRAIDPAFLSFEPGVEATAAAAGGDGGGAEQGFDGGMDMAPVDLDQAMGSFSPEWANDTVR